MEEVGRQAADESSALLRRRGLLAAVVLGAGIFCLLYALGLLWIAFSMGEKLLHVIPYRNAGIFVWKVLPLQPERSTASELLGLLNQCDGFA